MVGVRVAGGRAVVAAAVVVALFVLGLELGREIILCVRASSACVELTCELVPLLVVV